MQRVALLALLLMLHSNAVSRPDLQPLTSDVGDGLPIAIYRDYSLDTRVHSDSIWAKECVFDINGSHYDFRRIGGSFEGNVRDSAQTKSQIRYRYGRVIYPVQHQPLSTQPKLERKADLLRCNMGHDHHRGCCLIGRLT